MGTDEIKGMLHEGIENIDDKEFLLTIKEILDHKYQSTKNSISDWQLKRIRESEKQIENGEYYSDEQVDKAINKWLGE